MYAILKNGLVLHRFEAGNEFRTVEILCDKFHARMISQLLRCTALKLLLRSKSQSDFLARYTNGPLGLWEQQAGLMAIG